MTTFRKNKYQISYLTRKSATLFCGNTDREIVCHIIDRTLSWGKIAEFIPYSELVEGFPVLCYFPRISRSAAYRSVSNLLDNGIIGRHRETRCVYSVNIPEFYKLWHRMFHDAQDNKLWNTVKSVESDILDQYNRSDIRFEPLTLSSEATMNIETAIRFAQRKSVAARKRNAEKPVKNSKHLICLIRYLADDMKVYINEYVTDKVRGQMNHFIKSYCPSIKKTPEWFVRESMEEWPRMFNEKIVLNRMFCFDEMYRRKNKIFEHLVRDELDDAEFGRPNEPREIRIIDLRTKKQLA